MSRVRLLRLFLRIFGVANMITAFGIPLLFGDVLLWEPRNLPTELMVGSLYFALGIAMMVAARNPLKHKLFLEFVILGNLFHAIVMVLFAERLVHIVLDAGFIALMGLVFLGLYPWGLKNFLRH